jgi:hypothetical protein
MGPGSVILFWLIIAGVLGTVWIGAFILFLVSSKKKWRILKWLSGLAVAGGIVIALGIGSLLAYGLVRSSVPKYVFADVFHSKPTKSIRDIKSKVFWFADTGSIYLCFQTDILTFRKLVPKDLPRITKAEFEEKGWHESGEHPSWWQAVVSDSDEIYFRATDFGKGKNFATETEWMTYDFQRQIGYYRFLGID